MTLEAAILADPHSACIAETDAEPRGPRAGEAGRARNDQSNAAWRLPTIRRHRARSNAGIRRSRTASCWKTTAKESGKSLGQELLRRLQDSFNRDRDKARDPAMQALCFLIAETAQQTAGLNKATHRELYWRTNPFYFRAFKIAVGKLLDALEPKGDIEPPLEMQFNVTTEEAGALENDFLKSFRDPESRGGYAARSIWASLRNVPLHTREEDKETKERLRVRSQAAYFRELYGMPNAARDLQIVRD